MHHKELYEEVTWKVVRYPTQQVFNYSHTIPGGSKLLQYSKDHSELGKTSILDLWHLSHGQVYIGHLGSSFGKLAWYEAMARHNTFIPYYTVDGHSVVVTLMRHVVG